MQPRTLGPLHGHRRIGRQGPASTCDRIDADSLDGDERVLLIAFIDLDRFKTINDRYGHDIGDHFLAAIGERMRGVLRDEDFVARIGGDEFVALSSPLRSCVTDLAAMLRTRLQAAMTGHFRLDGVTIDYAGPSIGIVFAEPGMQADELLARADAAMYVDKRLRAQSMPPTQ